VVLGRDGRDLRGQQRHLGVVLEVLGPVVGGAQVRADRDRAVLAHQRDPQLTVGEHLGDLLGQVL
jgi:hypothetical protein